MNFDPVKLRVAPLVEMSPRVAPLIEMTIPRIVSFGNSEAVV